MKKLIFTSAIISILLILASCGGVKDSTKIENVSVSFSVPELSGRNARTIMPTNMEESDITKVTLYAEKYEGSTKKEYELSKSEWLTLAAFEQENFTIAVGKYSFILNICANNGFSEAITQTCTLDDVIIDGSTKTISFDELKYANDYGYVLYNISWPKKDVIAKVEAALYQGTELKYSQTLMRNGTDSGSTATATMRVNNGSYISKLLFYNNNDDTTPFNTITDVIKVNGYKTEYEISMALELLNIKYSVTFNPNGGRWKDGSTGNKTATRNAYDGFVSPAELEKQGWIFDGWLDEDGNSIDELVTPGSEESARDWTVYANWVKKASGNITLDNGALTITAVASSATTGTLLDNGVLYQNDTITFTAKDNAGNDVTDDVEFEAKLLYKGSDINPSEETATKFFSFSGRKIILNGAAKTIPIGSYQLYVTASYELPETGFKVFSSNTFEIVINEVKNSPNTVALYSKSSTNTYSYYLVDSAAVDSTNFGSEVFSSNTLNISFDASGNIYNLNDAKKLVSNNELFKNQQLDLSDDLSVEYGKSSKGVGFTIDVTTNTAYGYVIESESDTYTLKVYKYPKLISDRSLEEKTSLSLSNISLKSGYKVSINNNLLYLYGTADYTNYKVIVYDISSGSMVQFSEFNVTEYLTASERGFASTTDTDNISVNDIFATEGALYLLVQEKVDVKSTSKDIYRRGSVIEYIPPETSGGTGTTRFLALKTTPAITKTAISNMALYYDSATNGNASGPLYAVSGTNNVSPSGREAVVTIENVGKTLAFPDIYGVNETEKYLSAPAKVIAVKPKKLVIADDGCAFYTDSECLKYKNMNRIVTVDLEDFVVESVQTTTAEFSSNISSYLKTNIAIDTLEEIKTSQEDGYYFESSVKEWGSATIEGIKDQLYLAVKPGE